MGKKKRPIVIVSNSFDKKDKEINNRLRIDMTSIETIDRFFNFHGMLEPPVYANLRRQVLSSNAIQVLKDYALKLLRKHLRGMSNSIIEAARNQRKNESLKPNPYARAWAPEMEENKNQTPQMADELFRGRFQCPICNKITEEGVCYEEDGVLVKYCSSCYNKIKRGAIRKAFIEYIPMGSDRRRRSSKR